ncbi:MAG: WbqC family protein, partial [Syntrophobacterales bacterium]
YKHAPYWEEHFRFLQETCSKQRQNLLELNLEILDYLRLALGIVQPFVRSSTFAIETSGSQRLVDICKALEAREYLTIASSHKYLDENLFQRHGIQITYYKYEPPIYPQLWGDFIANLSVLDLILTCGPKSVGLIKRAGWLV